MSNTQATGIPSWLLYAVPSAFIAAMVWFVVFDSSTSIGAAAGVIVLLSTGAAFIVVPVAIYALLSHRELRTLPQLVGVAVCALPILFVISPFIRLAI